jgi:hypothetical protein
MPRKPVIAVVGASDPSPALEAEAEALGRALVDAGWRVATGGLGGVMAAVSRGARSSARHTDGDVIGILPGVRHDQANAWVDVAIPTGMGHLRNALCVLIGDVVVACGGGAGTLSEIAMAWVHDRPVVALDLEGWSAELAGRRLDGRRADAIVRASDAAEAVAAVRSLLTA